jgi:hypothetical protein
MHFCIYCVYGSVYDCVYILYITCIQTNSLYIRYLINLFYLHNY